MYSQIKAGRSYRRIATETASPGQLVLLLFNGSIRFLEQARVGFTLGDPKEFNECVNNNIQRAQAIINEMNQALNLASGGEFAVRMRSLYDYFDRRLHDSNMTKTDLGLNEVIRQLTVLRDAWSEMLQTAPGSVDHLSGRSSTTSATN
jgi:flagellar protein FliS